MNFWKENHQNGFLLIVFGPTMSVKKSIFNLTALNFISSHYSEIASLQFYQYKKHCDWFKDKKKPNKSNGYLPISSVSFGNSLVSLKVMYCFCNQY